MVDSEILSSNVSWKYFSNFHSQVTSLEPKVFGPTQDAQVHMELCVLMFPNLNTWWKITRRPISKNLFNLTTFNGGPFWCVCAHVCGYMWTHRYHLHVEVRGHPWMSFPKGYLFLSLLWFHFKIESIPGLIQSSNSLGWLTSEPSGSTCLCFPSTRITSCTTVPEFWGVLRIELMFVLASMMSPLKKMITLKFVS